MTRRSPSQPSQPHPTAPCAWANRDGQPCPHRAVSQHPEFGPLCSLHARICKPHHTAPCLHPTQDGRPCPNKAITHHAGYGPICAMHAHRSEASEGRTATILIRLTPEEKQTVEVVAGTLDVSLSDLARTMLVGLPMPEPPPPKLDAQTYVQLAKLGTNINQIAHQLNAHAMDNHGRPDTEIQELLAHLGDLDQIIREMRLRLAGAP